MIPRPFSEKEVQLYHDHVGYDHHDDHADDDGLTPPPDQKRREASGPASKSNGRRGRGSQGGEGQGGLQHDHLDGGDQHDHLDGDESSLMMAMVMMASSWY